MHGLGSRFACPKCNSRSGIPHCKSPTCSWHACYKCMGPPKAVVFDSFKRFFIWEK